ncbi:MULTISPECIES: cytochrome c [unclassified Campylobacter]|uniref:cytochrome c n=1 Tax=unclassified Campylobacter TaxID=2593542 RepID=UPI0022EA08E6|nr:MULTISPECIES: cytochrome c [unclassified Campylobacter]MDA3055113.1 cytochrome c [Campylobacter sp. VBCF_07 NA4]MDA3061363.1 cytochrome c [Campylobacter sp. VBCF_02 NA5]MDA3070882.1 cytochrome c [Campylobacter sp. VBCF_08 NA3]WBR54023.1 c-type cytochrome [Campylobacter sp. VBCF_01 NA2]
MKILKLSFLACFCACALLGANEPEESYVFEAKGEFAKELKSLIEKHSKDENITVNVYKNDGSKGRVLNSIKHNPAAAKEEGAKIFAAKCASCHGSNGEKRAHGVSKKIKNLSAGEIAMAISDYGSDYEYGGKKAFLMNPIALSTTSTEIGYIIAFLKGDTSFLPGGSSSARGGNTDISTTPSEQGSYLK